MQTPSVMERMSTYKDVGALVLKYFPKISHERDHIARGLGVEHDVWLPRTGDDLLSDRCRGWPHHGWSDPFR